MSVLQKKIYAYDDAKEIIRERQLYILNTVIEICYHHKLNYWLDAGTLLGAVRHKGFIPWDDDIDIGLMRKDYEKLLIYLSSELPNNLVLQTIKTDSRYGFMFAKVRDLNSHIYGDIEYIYNGVFIDIFPFDYVASLKIIGKIQYSIVQGIVGLRYAVTFRKKNLLIKKILKYFIDKNFIYINIYKTVFLLNNIFKQKKYIGNGLVCPWAFNKSIRSKEVYFPLKKIIFEEKMYYVPYDNISYLKSLYGSNYMTPIKDNNTKHIEKISFLLEEK